MTATSEQMRETYRRRARNYDVFTKRLYLPGYRAMGYRSLAVREVNLKKGDTVIDAGCGTGLNFAALQSAVGPAGHIIGVDLSDAMLDKANERIRRYGWENIQLIEADLGSYEFPANVSGILSSLVITLLPNYDQVIMRGLGALSPGGRMVILDHKIPAWWPRSMVRLLNPLVTSVGGDVSMADRRPWEILARNSRDYVIYERYGGFAYIARGRPAQGDGKGAAS